MKLHKIIKQCITDKGAETVASIQFVGCLDDEYDAFEAADAKPYKIILREIITQGYSKKILELRGNSPDIIGWADEFAKKNLRQEVPTLYLFNSIAYGLGWIKEEPNMRKLNNMYVVAGVQSINPQTTQITKPSLFKSLYNAVCNTLKEDIEWLLSKDIVEKKQIGLFITSLICLIVSIIVIVICWLDCIGYAPVWTWVLLESMVVLIVTYFSSIIKIR